jgi:hypothetical protein
MNLRNHSRLVATVAAALILAACDRAASAQDTPTRETASPIETVPGTLPAARRQLLVKNLAQVESALQAVEDGNPSILELKNQVQELIDAVHALRVDQPKEEKKEEKPAGTARKVMFRPPLMRPNNRPTRWVVVCQDRRVTSYDLGTKHPESEHFELKQNGLAMELVRKPGQRHAGETETEFLTSGSKFRRQLQQYGPQDTNVQFAVYPDSFEVFRAARKLVWDRKFEANWIPQLPGVNVGVGYGAGSNQ